MDRLFWQEIVEGERAGTLSRLARFLLSLSALLYTLAVRLRNLAYNLNLLPVQRLPCPVISVGNIVVGGTGKSPLVHLLAGELRESGKRVAVLSRGYGATDQASPFPRLVADGERVLLTAREAGDEPAMLARALRSVVVFADPDRARSGRMAVERFGVELLILDDGFQHRRVARDVNILLLDCSRPFGNGRLLPAGPLREPWKAIARADIIILTRCDQKPDAGLLGRIARLNADAAVFTATHRARRLIEIPSGKSVELDFLDGKRIASFSGIARPRDFERLLAGSGATLVYRRAFDDHHYFDTEEMEEIVALAQSSRAEAVVTTAKDATRIPPSFSSPLPFFSLEIEMRIGAGKDKLLESVLNLLKIKGS